MNKRIWSMTALLAILALLVTACGGGGATATTFPTESLEVTEAATEPTGATEAATVVATEPAAATEEATVGAVATVAGTEPAAATEPVGAGTGEIDCRGAAQGDTVTMLYQWSGTEEASLNQILQPVLEACGIAIEPESTRDQALLDTRVQGGNPPDIAFWNVTQLTQYQDDLMELD